ncbi:MAG: hypothetical protein KJ749_02425 [Planctomycetes bacterium]|nr:hypothetical protein [Planctomycetota bacterium]
MERLRQLLDYITTQMSVLSVSQRVAIGLCAALIVGSLLWLLKWSTVPEMVPLVNTEFAYEDLDGIEQALGEGGVSWRTQGTRVFVRAADRHNALRLLHTANALPEGSLFDMAAAVANQNPFQSPADREYSQNYAKGNELAKIIATYPFIKKASVMIQNRAERRIGGPSYVQTASVVVTLAPGKEMTSAMVDGFAKLVAGAVAGLQPHNVNITDSRTGQSHSVSHPDEAGGADYLAIVKQHEGHLLSKIMNKLADIPGLRATVTVELDTSKRVTRKQTHAQPQPKTESERSEEMTSDSAAAEPGVQANLGQALTANVAGGGSTSEETKTEYFDPQISETETIEQLPFARKQVTATVGIPRSFLVGVYSARYPEKTDPKDEDPEFTALRDEQVSRIKASVEKIVMADDPNDVEVDVYPDMEWSADGGGWSQVPGGVAAAVRGSDEFDAVGLARTYGPQAGLLTLALMSMFMMMRVVRKSSEVARTGRKSHGPGVPDDSGTLAVGPHAVGRAEVSESLLAGREVDDDTLRYQELGEEVSKMVESDPEGAAELLRRWVTDEQ